MVAVGRVVAGGGVSDGVERGEGRGRKPSSGGVGRGACKGVPLS